VTVVSRTLTSSVRAA